jgi:hypothetical protein
MPLALLEKRLMLGSRRNKMIIIAIKAFAAAEAFVLDKKTRSFVTYFEIITMT